MSTLSIKSKYAYAHAADPVYSLRRNSLRHQTLEASLCRFYKVPIPWGVPRDPKGTHGSPRGPMGTQGDPRGPKGTQGNPREPKGTQGDPRGPKGTQGDPRGPKGAFGALGGMGQWGPLGLFRSYPEWKTNSSGGLLRMESHSKMKKAVAKESRPKGNGSKW